jgi:thiamine biosynthesis protein ThiS
MMLDRQVRLTVNGKPAEFAEVRTVGDLVRARGLKTSLVAVELNGAIVPRSEFDTREVGDGDQLEIVHFVGGG